MKQILVNPKEGKIILEDVPAPLCKDNSVSIQVQYSLISSGTELASFRHLTFSDNTIIYLFYMYYLDRDEILRFESKRQVEKKSNYEKEVKVND